MKKRLYLYSVYVNGALFSTLARSVGNAVHLTFRGLKQRLPKTDHETKGWEGVSVVCEREWKP